MVYNTVAHVWPKNVSCGQKVCQLYYQYIENKYVERRIHAFSYLEIAWIFDNDNIFFIKKIDEAKEYLAGT